MPAGRSRTPAGPRGDPFGTAGLRRAVLDAWAASPARFREDANAEEALAIGGYADRLLIELAANALDAARQADVPGRVRFTLHSAGQVGQLRAANVGAPLTADGVSGLASLRASAKRGRSATVGHFGVGFTAVLAVTDSPEVLSRTGGVRFSRPDTAASIAALGVTGLDAEVAARGGQVPALRLPWPIGSDPDPLPAGFDTQVRLPLRDGLEPVLAELLRNVGDDLLWALPGLMAVEVELPGHRLRVISREDVGDGITVIDCAGPLIRYRAHTRNGTIPGALLTQRPTEERARDQWQLTWVLPDPDEQPAPTLGFALDVQVEPVFLGAPTPTDEPLSLPARLVGTFPVDDTRRRLAAGPLTRYLLDQAAAAYVELFTAVPAAQRFSLVPTGGFPLGPVDAELHDGIVTRLSRAPVLLTASGEPVPPVEACVVTRVSDAAAMLLGRAVPGLLLPPHSPGELVAMRLLGVTTMPLAEATGALAGIDGTPTYWREVYDALADQDPEDLANLPVPLAGGGRRIGPAGCLLPGADAVPVEVLTRAAMLAPDLRMVHPEAAHPLLLRLGAVLAEATALLADAALLRVFEDFRADLDDSDPEPGELRELAHLALDLASASPPAAGPLLIDVVLTDADGEAWPAGDLLAPGAPLAAVLAADADLPMIGLEWAQYPQQTLERVGVRTGLKIVSVDSAEVDLPDLGQWWSEVVDDGLPPETFDAIADLDLVDDAKWPLLLEMIGQDRNALATLTSGPDPSYTRWWLSRFALLAGEPPNHWRVPEAVMLTGLYGELPVRLDPVVAQAVGVLVDGVDAVRSDPAELVTRLVDAARALAPGVVPELTRLACDALEQNPDIRLPASVRTLSGAVVDADDALVLDLPWYGQVIDADRLVAGGGDPVRVARLLDLDLVSVRVVAKVNATGGRALTTTEVQAAQRAALSLGHEFSVLFPLETLLTSPALSVRLGDGGARAVRWWSASDSWIAAEGVLLVDGSAAGIGRAVAFRAGCWRDRELAAAAAAGDSAFFAENGW